MKLKSIKIGEDVFQSEEILGTKFQNMFFQTYQSILDQKDADSFIVQSGLETLQKISRNQVLGIPEKIALHCLKIRTGIDFVLSDETQIPHQDKIAWVSAEDMVHLITLCKSEEDINYMIESIQTDIQKSEALEIVVDILKNLDYSSLDFKTWESICSLLREFDFNWTLISCIENNSHMQIKVLRNMSYPREQNIVLQYHITEETSTFHLEGQLAIKLKRVQVKNPKMKQESYFSGITFWKKAGLLILNQGSAFAKQLDEKISLNSKQVILLEDASWHHIYIPEENTIILLSSVIVGVYYVDKNGYKLDEDDENFQENISQTGVKKIMRLILDAEKWFFYDFDGEDFWELKIQTENMILWHPAKSNLH